MNPRIWASWNGLPFAISEEPCFNRIFSGEHFSGGCRFYLLHRWNFDRLHPFSSTPSDCYGSLHLRVYMCQVGQTKEYFVVISVNCSPTTTYAKCLIGCFTPRDPFMACTEHLWLHLKKNHKWIDWQLYSEDASVFTFVWALRDFKIPLIQMAAHTLGFFVECISFTHPKNQISCKISHFWYFDHSKCIMASLRPGTPYMWMFIWRPSREEFDVLSWAHEVSFHQSNFQYSP